MKILCNLLGVTLASLLAGALGCSTERHMPTSARTVDGADTLISPSTELLTQPSAIALHADGVAYVADFGHGRVIALGVAGIPLLIGRKGRGPGELQAPAAIRVDSDTIRVVDPGNSRIELFTRQGRHIRSYTNPAVTMTARFDIAPNGRLAVASHGLGSDSLVTIVNQQGDEIARVGSPIAPITRGWDLAAMKRDVAARRVPDVLLNGVLPRFGASGHLWIVFLAAAKVEERDSAGRKLLEVHISVPALNRIKSAFFDRNLKEPRQFAFYPLQYFADAVVVGEDLWLLLNLPDGEPREVIVVGRDGSLRQHLLFAGVKDAWSMAVDVERRRVYFASPASASVVSVTLPSQEVSRLESP